MQVKINTDELDAHIEKVVRRLLSTGGDDPWLDSKESAAYLGISDGTLRNLVYSGALKRHGTPGTKLRFRRSDLDAFAQTQKS